MPYCWLKHPHPSKTERADCNFLRARHKAGEIQSYRLYPSIKLHVYRARKKVLWKTWKADFEVTELDGSISIHESKGWNRSNEEFKLKATAFLKEYPHIPLYVNRVRVDPQSKRFVIPGLNAGKARASKMGWSKHWLKENFKYDFKLRRYVKNGC